MPGASDIVVAQACAGNLLQKEEVAQNTFAVLGRSTQPSLGEDGTGQQHFTVEDKVAGVSRGLRHVLLVVVACGHRSLAGGEWS